MHKSSLAFLNGSGEMQIHTFPSAFYLFIRCGVNIEKQGKGGGCGETQDSRSSSIVIFWLFFVKVAVVIRWGFLDTQVSLAPTPDSPSSTIVSDFHSVSVSETSQSVQTTMQWPTRWLTWQPTWRCTWWPTWRWTKKTMLMYARERSWCSCSHENEVYWAEAIWCEVYPIRVVF